MEGPVGCCVGRRTAETHMGRERDWVSQAKQKNKKEKKEKKEYQKHTHTCILFENICICADIYQKMM